MGFTGPSFLRESVYEITRWWRQLWYAIDTTPNRELVPLTTRCLLVRQGFELPSWDGFQGLDPEMIQQRLAKVTGTGFERKYSWLVRSVGRSRVGCPLAFHFDIIEREFYGLPSNQYIENTAPRIDEKNFVKKKWKPCLWWGLKSLWVCLFVRMFFRPKPFKMDFWNAGFVLSKIAPMLRVQPGQKSCGCLCRSWGKRPASGQF